VRDLSAWRHFFAAGHKISEPPQGVHTQRTPVDGL